MCEFQQILVPKCLDAVPTVGAESPIKIFNREVFPIIYERKKQKHANLRKKESEDIINKFESW